VSSFWTACAEPFAEGDDERAVLRAAKAGDEVARERVIRAYLPALRNGMRRLNLTAVRESAQVERDDARQAAILGLFEALAAFDPDKHHSLAGLAPRYITGALSALTDTVFGYAVPERTRERYAQVMRAADGDPDAAAAMAPAYKLATDTFWEVHLSYAVTGAYDSELSHADDPAAPWTPREFTAAEDAVLTTAALSALDDHERAVVALSYGIGTDNPLTIREVADRLGVTKSAAHRTLSAALVKMRGAIGAAE
jgi:RNA polymerase sigma factor (sigma-70 family)